MELEVLEKTERELEIKIKGEGHTLCGFIQEIFLHDPRIEMITYSIEHPLKNEVNMYIRVASGHKLDVIFDVLSKSLSLLNELRQKFNKVLQ